MNNSLTPTYTKQFGDKWVLWFAKSNSYSVVESSFKNLLDVYLDAYSLDVFKTTLADNGVDLNIEDLVETFTNYLSDSNQPRDISKLKNISLDTTNRNILKQYSIKGKSIQVFYDSELVQNIIHPALSHLTVEPSHCVQTTFDIYLRDDDLLFFKDEKLIIKVFKKDYHLLQGKFIMHLLCTIHHKHENEWISTFHGSTITDGNTSILFIGESGKGKSTLCALLNASGFDLLADDVSPMLSENKNIYYNPSAISIKEGAFDTLQPIINNFENLPIVQFNKTKGRLKYVPCNSPSKNNYPCKAIILVNYENKVKTQLEKVCIKTVLETLIPESWLSPNPLHAIKFLDWLETVNTYKLTYNNTKSVTEKVSDLFKQLNKS
ncbi:hypothetical protein [Winogradskyella sp. R77965]|uniref:hypothetical protein n=1 Tax=Winogradskyella sp. R77965 TaxID=3093872 RepID=UPI0037DCF251